MCSTTSSDYSARCQSRTKSHVSLFLLHKMYIFKSTKSIQKHYQTPVSNQTRRSRCENWKKKKKKSLFRFTQILHTLRAPAVGTHDETAKAGFSVLPREQWWALFLLLLPWDSVWLMVMGLVSIWGCVCVCVGGGDPGHHPTYRDPFRGHLSGLWRGIPLKALSLAD